MHLINTLPLFLFISLHDITHNRHTFCSTCLQTLPEMTCPFCMQSIEADIQSLPRNLTLLSLISGFNSLMASQQQQLPLPIPPIVPVTTQSAILLRSSSDSSTSSTSSTSRNSHHNDHNNLKEDFPDSETDRRPLGLLTIDEVQSLLESTNMNKFKTAFLENEVDGETLCECFTPEDLKDLGITVCMCATVL